MTEKHEGSDAIDKGLDAIDKACFFICLGVVLIIVAASAAMFFFIATKAVLAIVQWHS